MGDSLNLGNPSDRGRLRGWVDTAPKLASRKDMPDPLTDMWRDFIMGLLDFIDSRESLAPKTAAHGTGASA